MNPRIPGHFIGTLKYPGRFSGQLGIRPHDPGPGASLIYRQRL